MNPCRCPQCAADPAPSWSPAHMQACEARMVATWPRAKQNEYFDKVARRRGQVAADQLRAAVRQLPAPRGSRR